jgi:hypothetical protein
MPGPMPYDQLVLDQRETLVDQLARAVAGVQGRPIASKPRTVEDEDAAWLARDPNVTPDHLAMIAQQTAQELGQQQNDDGSPMWAPEQIQTEVAARQMHAQYPYRQYTYTLGEGLDDILNPALTRTRGYWPFADTHERGHGHYPDNAYAGTVRPAVILATGRKEG